MKKLFLFSFLFISLSLAKANAFLPFGLNAGLRFGNSSNNKESKARDIKKDSKFFVAPNINFRLFSLRGELEYIYRHNFLKINNSSVRAETVMANLYYNFFDIYLAKLYVNGGYGNTKFTGAGSHENKNTFSVGLGANISLFDALNVDAGYRYINMGKINSVRQDSHDIYVGFRIGF